MKDRYLGCLLGVAVGDCLGAPLEGSAAPKEPVTEILMGGRGSDDLAMTLCMADAIVEAGNYERETVVERYVEWLRGGPKGIGRSTYLSLSLIGSGEPPDLASEQAHAATGGLSAGNGVVMRCSPVPLRYPGRRRPILDMICIDGSITHFDPLAGLGAAAIGLVIDSLLAGDTDKEMTILSVADEIAAAEGSADWKEPREKVAAILRRVVEQENETVFPTGYVLDTVHAALRAFLTTDSFEDCLIRAVNYGGDADTIGAVAGSLAGTRHGASAIPERWRCAIAERPRIESLAEELHTLARQG